MPPDPPAGNPVLREILERGEVELPGGARRPLHSAISPEEGAFLQALVRELRPAETLEVGLAYGVSALYLCEALRGVGGRRHTAIDPNQRGGPRGDSWEGGGLHTLARAGLAELVEFHEAPSFEVLPRLVAEGRRIQLAFIDGWHTFDYTLVDLFYVDQMLDPGGVVVLDDADWPAVRKVCRYAVTNLAYEPVPPPGPQPPEPPHSWARRLLEAALAASPKLRRLARPELACPDRDLGLSGTCVALRKLGPDRRRWDHHEDF